MSATALLPLLRDLFSRRPETCTLKPWHLAWVLFALGYTDELESEAEIFATAEVARTDWTGAAA